MNYLDLWFVKSLPWLLNRNLFTEIKYLFIAILCAKMSRVNKAKRSVSILTNTHKCTHSLTHVHIQTHTKMLKLYFALTLSNTTYDEEEVEKNAHV